MRFVCKSARYGEHVLNVCCLCSKCLNKHNPTCYGTQSFCPEVKVERGTGVMRYNGLRSLTSSTGTKENDSKKTKTKKQKRLNSP